jgi:simple sugar transport system ATP-binding protein
VSETAAPGASPVLLRLAGITKRFGGLLANDAVDLDLRAGEILALLGENGAGKTTLTNILFGHYTADAGEVSVADAGAASSRSRPARRGRRWRPASAWSTSTSRWPTT